MKLRLRENSIRFRLQMSEIERLGETGSVKETIRFADNQEFIYTITADSEAGSIAASFDNNHVSISVPVNLAKEWVQSDKVGLEHTQVVDEGLSLNILLEKDFKCLTRRDGEGDMYANPNESRS